MYSVIDLSVIIPIYGVEKYIERCAVSLFSQTIKEGIEFIFVNDKSPDNSMAVLNKVIAKYPERKNQIKIIQHDKNRGLAGARLTALKESKGKYVIPCDSDDWVEKDMYETMLSKAKQEDADMVICQYFINFPNREIVSKSQFSTSPEIMLSNILMGKSHCGLWNKMAKRKLYEKLSPSFSEGLNMWEDVSVLPRLIHLCKTIAVIDKPFYHYFQDNAEAYTQHWKTAYSKNIYDAVKINIDYFRPLGYNVDVLAWNGLLGILSNETNKGREEYLKKFDDLQVLKSINYKYFSLYRRILARALFNRHFRTAQLLMLLKRIANKFR